MTRSPLIMLCVAVVIGIAGLVVVTRRVTTDAGVYGRRIAGMMLLMLALILGWFGIAMASWGPGS